MGINLELNFCDDGIYLNYWDLAHGKDVCGKIYKQDCIEVDGKFMSYNVFFDKVKKIAEEELDCCLASEESLAKDWLSPEENEAWKDL